LQLEEGKKKGRAIKKSSRRRPKQSHAEAKGVGANIILFGKKRGKRGGGRQFERRKKKKAGKVSLEDRVEREGGEKGEKLQLKRGLACMHTLAEEKGALPFKTR